MNRIARGYTDDELSALADYFSAVKPKWSETGLTRRSFVAGAAAAAEPAERRARAAGMPRIARDGARVVIIGGGFGGASLARYFRRNSPNVAVTLIEKDTQFVTCPFSNFVLGGLLSIDKLTFGYDKVKAAGVNVVHDLASKIDPVKKTVTTAERQNPAL